ncbi:MAG: glycosyltransferase, partial [Elusimicrobiales bacterium]
TGVYLHDYGCSLKVYKREIIEKIDLYGEMHRFIPALCSYVGAKISEVEVNHRPRIKGKSKYGMIRIFKVILDLLTVKFMGNFMTKPIYFFGIFSFGLISVSSLFFLITLYNKWYNHIFVKDQPLFLVAIFLSLAGLQLGLIGIIAEMLTRIYYSSEKRDYYIKEKIL